MLMRYRPATVAVGIALAIVVVLAVVGFYAVRSQVPASPSPSPAATASATVAAPSPSPSPTASPTASPNAPGDATVKVTKVTVPPEFHYVVVGSGENFRVLMLDLDAARATEVATVQVVGVQTAPAQTRADVSASNDGRAVLLLVTVPEATSSLYVIRPEAGDSKLLLKGKPIRAVVSPDGARFAVARHDADRTLTGLWVGTTADGAAKRLVADEPDFVGAPPLPFAFSRDGSLLVFGLGVGDTGYQAMLGPVSSAEGRVDRAVPGPRIVGGEFTTIGPASGAEFRSEQEAFVWSSRGAFGGQTVAYTFDLISKRTTELYKPSNSDLLIGFASWRPRADQFATTESPNCCGASRPQAVWLRDRGGSARKLGDYSFLVEVWWSRDGARLLGRMGGDDATSGIADLLTAKQVMQFCLRGGTPGSCT
jgi:hypothetical protein